MTVYAKLVADERQARNVATTSRNRDRVARRRASRLIRPAGWDAASTRDAAVRITGLLIGQGGGRTELVAVLRATGLLYDPEQRSGMQLAYPQSHPYGERTR